MSELKKYNADILASYRKTLKYYLNSMIENIARSHEIRRMDNNAITVDEDGSAQIGTPNAYGDLDLYVKATWARSMNHDAQQTMKYYNLYQNALIDDKMQDLLWTNGIEQKFREARDSLDPDWLLRETRSI